MADDELRAQFGLLDWEETLIHDDPGFRDASPTSRLDAFFAEGADGSGLKFTEYNAETPAGAAYGDSLTEAFLSLPVMADFRREYNCLPLPSAPGCRARAARCVPAVERHARSAAHCDRGLVRRSDAKRVRAVSRFLQAERTRVRDRRSARDGVSRTESSTPAICTSRSSTSGF